MMSDTLWKGLVLSVAYSVVGLIVFAAGFWLIRKILPYDVHKEIEQDHNVALGIVIGAFILGQALIISAAIHGG